MDFRIHEKYIWSLGDQILTKPRTSYRIWTYHSILPSSLLGPLFSHGHSGKFNGQNFKHKVPNERYEYDLSTDTSKSNFGSVV